MRLDVSNRAQRDIDVLHAYGLQNFGKPVADGYVPGLLDLFDLLQDNSHMGRDLAAFRKNTWAFLFRSHIVIYRVNARNLRIVRVPHHKQNWMALL